MILLSGTDAPAPGPSGNPLEPPTVLVRRALDGAAEDLRRRGVPVPELDGKLLRPMFAWALVPPALRRGLGATFWSGALAVQMVHEASLLHDDVLDGADERRGKDTLAASAGVGTALVVGDHFLTAAYRAAVETRSTAFVDRFVVAVERTVAGEVAQGRARGERLDAERYLEIVTGKSGELFGAAAALGGATSGATDLEERTAFGCAVGALYQRVDDLLDFCPAADTGKPPLQDYRQRKWTWVLDQAGLHDFSIPEAVVLDVLFLDREGGPSAAVAALSALREERDRLVRRAAVWVGDDGIVAALLDGWVEAAARGVATQERALRAAAAVYPARRSPANDAEATVAKLAASVGPREQWPAYFALHGRTFRFAARLFPPGRAASVSGLYAYCRFTDDLVDAPADGARRPERVRRLEAWRGLSREAFDGRRTGIQLLDEVLGEAGRRGVSWRYPDALLAGMELDLDRTRYEDWDDLETYTFGVAGAVGGWMTQLFGLDDASLLDAAHALGHGMQLTNILRDVGEDLGRGRLYLPRTLLARHGLTPGDLDIISRESGPMPASYRRALDDLMARADGWYSRAWPGIRRLPPWFRRPIAVAAEAYRGIHRQVRRNGYDNLRRRAHTRLPAKLALAVSGLARARG